ncbi:MAG TPA: MOSC domain-containing protein [Gemmatimonadaceae bacterium]|nr:MOSC domain-containing protein [Gemmatimonadaceae bacterium]
MVDDRGSRSSGRIERIWIKRAHRGPMDPAFEAALVVDHGLAGNVDRSRRRQVTLFELEAWTQATADVSAVVDPATRRANILVSGIALAHTRGRTLQVGGARVCIGGELTPCERMDEARPGLRVALIPDWRGGVFAHVTAAGSIRVGDIVRWESPPDPTARDATTTRSSEIHP